MFSVVRSWNFFVWTILNDFTQTLKFSFKLLTRRWLIAAVTIPYYVLFAMKMLNDETENN